MRVLELRAIYLNYRSRIAKQNLRGRFHNARLTGTCRPKEQQIANGPSRRIQPSAEHLVQIHQRLHSFFLPNDLRAKRGLEITRIVAAYGRVKRLARSCFHGLVLASARLTGPTCVSLTHYTCNKAWEVPSTLPKRTGVNVW